MIAESHIKAQPNGCAAGEIAPGTVLSSALSRAYGVCFWLHCLLLELCDSFQSRAKFSFIKHCYPCGRHTGIMSHHQLLTIGWVTEVNNVGSVAAGRWCLVLLTAAAGSLGEKSKNMPAKKKLWTLANYSNSAFRKPLWSAPPLWNYLWVIVWTLLFGFLATLL